MRINWRKTLLVAADVVLGAYIIVAFTAFNKPKESTVCNNVIVNIQDETTNGFITPQEITQRLKSGGLYPLSKPLDKINTRAIEEALRESPFVRTAECYKTLDGKVRITLTQRMPIVRIKSINGDDYYIDDNNSIMPNSHYTSNLIIATGYINKWYAKNYISLLAADIMQSKLWKSQIVQINVTPLRGIELVPRVGDHIVYIGQLPEASDLEKREKEIKQFVEAKLSRLEKFYKYGLTQAGWNKYSYIDIEFDNQIICKKRTQNR